ncbi:MAG: ArnT family glycosyltransferase, partial [Armatimonadota bacterium]
KQQGRGRGTHGVPAEIVLLGALAAAWATTYAMILPLGGGPDEPAHLQLIRFVAETGRLYTFGVDDARAGYEVQQPPLYYVIGAAVAKALAPLGPRRLQYALRLISVAIGTAVTFLAWATARRALSRDRRQGPCDADDAPNDDPAPFVAAAFAGLLPHVLLLASIVNNDAAAMLFWSLALLAIVRAMDVSAWSRWALAGAVVGLAILSKLSGLVLIPVLLAAAGLAARRLRSPSEFAKAAGASLAACALVSGWWFARCYALSGRLITSNVTPFSILTQPMYEPQRRKFIWMAIKGPYLSFWAQMGWLPATVAPAVYVILSVLALAAGLGLLLLVRRSRGPAAPRLDRLAVMVTAALCVAVVLYAYVFLRNFYMHEGGRYMMPAIVAFAVLVAAGLREWAKESAAAAVKWAMVALLMALNALCLYNLLTYLIPTYGPKA